MNKLNKLAYAIEMAFEVPKIEKDIAKDALDKFNEVINALDLAKDHLHIMYDPFKKYETISTEALIEKRGVINRYKQQVKKNYNKVKYIALLAIDKLNYFSTDTHILELINSFKDSIQNLEKQINILLDILDNYESVDFKNNIILAIEGVKQQSAQVEKLIKDRVIDHVDSNILIKNWMSDTSDELKMEIKNKIPIITKLYNERQDALDSLKSNIIPEPNGKKQVMNPGDVRGLTEYPNDFHNGSE